jgi:quercetin 2,3-dioxygenase
MIKVRRSNERGFFNHGWLKSFHSFSFADYYDRNHMNFGNLRVINEDFIAAGNGFGEHPHHNMEIITYVISGELSHKDSMGNSSIILPEEVQVMSAGSGVIHSEFNSSKSEETHLLQIWILPKEKQIAPRYEQKSFSQNFQNNNLVLIVSNDGRDGSLKINQNADIFLAKLMVGEELNFNSKFGDKIWIQVIAGEITIDEFSLKKGDAVAVDEEQGFAIYSKEQSEFLIFKL